MGIITFNNVTSKDLGIEVETFPDYVAPEKEYQVTHVPGRNGDLVVDTKTFQNVPRSYEVSVATNGVPIEVVNAAVARFKSSSRMPIKSLKSEIKAVQDLHGYDHPWPAGGGKNLCPQEVVENVTWAYDLASHATDIVTALNNLPAGTYTVSYTSTITSVYDSFTSETALAYSGGMSILYNGKDIAVSMSQITRSQALAHYSVQKSLKLTIASEDVGKVTHVYTYGLGRNTATEGAPSGPCGTATFSNIQIEVGSTATDFAPYENICPITGFDSGVITRCGKNLCDIANQTIPANINRTISIDTFFLKGGYSYTVHCKQTPSVLASQTRNTFFVRRPDGTNVYGNSNVTIQPMTFTAETDGIYNLMLWGHTLSTETTYSEIQIELGSTATTFEPYNGNTYTFPFRQTIYGGYVDNNGDKPITHKSVDLGSLTWSYNSTHKLFYAVLNPAPVGEGSCMSSLYQQIPANTLANNQSQNYKMALGWIITNNCINIRNTDYTDANEFKTAMSGVYLFYELAAPRATSGSEGNLVITHGYDLLNPNESWNYSASWARTNTNVFFTTRLHYEIKFEDHDYLSFKYCTNLPVGSRNSIYDSDTNMLGLSGSGAGQLTVRINKTICPDVASFVQWITDNQVYYVYELANPMVLPITSQNIFTLLGNNTIFSNSGDVSVKVEPSFSTIINQVAEWLHSASGYARLEDTYEPDYYRMAYYSESLSVENLFNEAGKATLNFICKPQRYLKSGETPIIFTAEGTIQNGTRFSSSPILKVTTNNTQGSVAIGNYSITIKAGAGIDPITIDCELQDAWSGTSNKNSYIVLTDGEFPVIDPGTQTVTFDGGVQSVEVIPRWWTV